MTSIKPESERKLQERIDFDQSGMRWLKNLGSIKVVVDLITVSAGVSSSTFHQSEKENKSGEIYSHHLGSTFKARLLDIISCLLVPST